MQVIKPGEPGKIHILPAGKVQGLGIPVVGPLSHTDKAAQIVLDEHRNASRKQHRHQCPQRQKPFPFHHPPLPLLRYYVTAFHYAGKHSQCQALPGAMGKNIFLAFPLKLCYPIKANFHMPV